MLGVFASSESEAGTTGKVKSRAGADPRKTEPVDNVDLGGLAGVLRQVPAAGWLVIAGGVAGSLLGAQGAYILENRKGVIIMM